MREKISRTTVFFVTSLLLLFVVVAGLILGYMDGNRERIIDQNEQYLEGHASRSAEYMEEVFGNASKSIALVSRLYELQMESTEFDYRLLNEMTEPTPFNYIRFVGLDGVSWSGEGVAVECADREYYLEGVQGKSGICYYEHSRFTNGSVLVFYTPLYYHGGLVGVVNGVLDTERLTEPLANRFFNTNADACIATPEGVVVASSWGKDGSLDGTGRTLLPDEMLSEDERAKVLAALQEGRSIGFRYKGRSGVGNAYLAPLAGGNFMLVQTFPAGVSSALMERVNRDALKLEIALIIAFLCYVAALAVYYIRRNGKLVREKKRLGQIVDSVKILYRRFVVFDLDSDSYEYLRAGDISALGLPPEGKYSDWLDVFRGQNESEPRFWGSMEDMGAEHLRRTLTQENWHSNREYQTPDGRWERLTLIKLDMERDCTSRILGAVEDITETKKRDEESRQALESAFHAAEAASLAKSDFLSRMSHDIRTPMNAIIGLTAIMGAHLDERERVVDCLAKISSSSKHLLSLINEVLDMSKIESGKLVLSEAEFELSALIDDLLGIVQPMVNAKHQELGVHIQNLEHEHVIGDSLRLQQVFLNILSNAVKYTGEGGHITVTLMELPGTNPLLGEYRFIVKDDGIGMTQEFLEKLYTPFERAEDERISKTQGSGLGMSIAQSIAQLMGGSISVESELGKGSCFTVDVSLKLQEENEEVLERLANLPVLVVDDEQIDCENTCLMLGELGMRGEWVLSGQEAVERVERRHGERADYYAVILDWKMPGMDGVETAKAIRRQVGPEMPIIILSAYDWSEIESEARAAGVDAFIGKPLFKSRLRGVFVSLQRGASENATDPLHVMRERNYSGKRVLLVEDNDLNQEIAKEILEMIGLAVDVAENGKAAVERFAASAENSYDLIFMDVQMPIMNGYEATRAIRELNRGDAAGIPIIAMTANTFSEDVQAAKDAGMNQHIGKPLIIDQLVAVLEKWLGE